MEIQTEKNLVILPNLYIVTNPVEVSPREDRVAISTISLGYEIHHDKVKACLLEAATRAGTHKAVVHIGPLGDYSVNYQLFAILKEADSMALFTKKSELNGHVLDVLHEAGIEIVSPAFMNQRQVNDIVFIPKKPRKKKEPETEVQTSEEVLLDKAVLADSLQRKTEKMEELEALRKATRKELDGTEDQERREVLESRLEKFAQFKEELEASIQEDQSKLEKK